MTELVVRGIVGWLAALLGLAIFGGALVQPVLEVHSAITEWLGFGYQVQLTLVQNDVHDELHMRAEAAMPLLHGPHYIGTGTAWIVRTGIDTLTPPWIVTLVLSVLVPLRAGRRRLVFVATALLVAWCTQFLVLPIVLAAGVLDVLQAGGSHAAGTSERLLMQLDALLQNGGTWLIALLAFLGVWSAFLRRRAIPTSIHNMEKAPDASDLPLRAIARTKTRTRPARRRARHRRARSSGNELLREHVG